MAPLKRYLIKFTWVGKLGTQTEYVNAINQIDAKQRFLAMYGDKVNFLNATEVK